MTDEVSSGMRSRQALFDDRNWDEVITACLTELLAVDVTIDNLSDRTFSYGFDNRQLV